MSEVITSVENDDTSVNDPTNYAFCPRCMKMYCYVSALGRWQCSYHPEPYDYSEDENGRERGYRCCGKRRRRPRYTMQALLTSAVEPPDSHIPGCTQCDCGPDLNTVHFADLHNVFHLFDDIGSMEGIDPENEVIYRSRLHRERGI